MEGRCSDAMPFAFLVKNLEVIEDFYIFASEK